MTVKPGTLDAALVGSWESVGRVENREVQAQFVFNADGWFSRRYFSDEGGIVETAQGNLKLKGSRIFPNDVWQYGVNSTDSFKLSAPGKEVEFTRVGTSDYLQDVLVGTWKTSFLILGATGIGLSKSTANETTILISKHVMKDASLQRTVTGK